MLLYILICLCLSLAGIAGLQAEARISEQDDVLSSFYADEEGEEAWADVIEDR
jgi:hypothetical protein